jgi:hypothetical protein
MLDIARGTTFDDQLYINYAVKAIKRSILELEIARSRPVYALTENLRAHLALTELASQLYYKGEVTAKRTADKFKLSEAFVAVNRKLGYFGKEPLIFFNVVDAHAQQIGHTLSKQNPRSSRARERVNQILPISCDSGFIHRQRGFGSNSLHGTISTLTAGRKATPGLGDFSIECFATSLKDIRATHLLEHTIDLRPGAIPSYKKAKRYTHSLRVSFRRWKKWGSSSEE